MAFGTAISGIKASTADLGIIGNNIANSSTTGFKMSRGEFADVYASSLLGVGGSAIGKGVAINSVSQQFTQGNINFTDIALDLAINGSGFFTLDDNGSSVYSRAGGFVVDRSGFVTNNQGMKLMAFQADNQGAITGQLGALQLNSSLIEPSATALVDMTANLDSTEVAPIAAWGGPFDAFAVPPTTPSPDMYNSSTSLTIFDGLGNPHLLSTYFVKSATAGQWDVHTLIDGVTASGPDTITFDSSGQFDLTSLPVEVNIVGWNPLDSTGAATGAAAQDLTLNLSQSTQYGSDFAVLSLDQDGFSTGQLGGIDIADNGIVFAQYTNGQALALGQVALANFTNAQGLNPIGGSMWAETFASGPPTLGEPGNAGLGLLQSGALEDSNVEITDQLVQMIVAQRNFQANAQVIQAEDTITQTVINIR
jgi:flagellar hook protein FlgE